MRDIDNSANQLPPQSGHVYTSATPAAETSSSQPPHLPSLDDHVNCTPATPATKQYSSQPQKHKCGITTGNRSHIRLRNKIKVPQQQLWRKTAHLKDMKSFI